MAPHRRWSVAYDATGGGIHGISSSSRGAEAEVGASRQAFSVARPKSTAAIKNCWDPSGGVQLHGRKLAVVDPFRRAALKSAAIAALVVSATLACSPARAQSPTDFSAIDTKLKACSVRNPSNPAISNCTAVATAAADRRLNEVYTAALNKLNQLGPDFNPEIPRRLIVAERAWIAFRDAECNYKSAIALGGTGEGYAYVACRYDQTKARVRALMAPDEPHIAR
jgi:uncharacterized protein YecT (DUF1311 family)